MARPETSSPAARPALLDLPASRSLLGHLALTRGADLLFLITPDATAATRYRQLLEDALPPNRRPILNLAPDVPNDPAALYQRLDQAPRLQPAGLFWIELPADVLHDFIPLAEQAWNEAFAGLNPHRNRLLKQLTAPLVIAGPAWLFQSFRSHAPDWFSVRSGVFDLARDIALTTARPETMPAEERAAAASAAEEPLTVPDFPPFPKLPLGAALDRALDALPPSARALLEILAWFDPEAPIPGWLVAAHPPLPGDADLRDSLDDLIRAGFLQQSEEGLWFRLHPLAAEHLVSHQQLSSGPPASLERAHEAWESAFPGNPGDPRTWSQWLAGLPHVLRLAGHLEAAGETTEAAGLLNYLGRLHLNRASYREAESCFLKALSLLDSVETADPRIRSTVINNLAQLLKETGRLTEAEPLMRDALHIDRAAYGDDHPTVAIDFNNLANLLQETDRLTEAEPLMREALRIDRAAYGDDHPTVAIRINNLACLLQMTGRWTEAEPMIRDALRIDHATYGDDHPTVAIRLNNLANLLQETGRLTEAEPLMRDALRIDRAAYGGDHPVVSRDLNNLAQLLEETGRLTEAEPLMRDALRIDRAAYGDSHPTVATDLNNLANLLQKTGRLTEAVLVMRNALRIAEDCLGSEHPDSKSIAGNLNVLLDTLAGEASAKPDDDAEAAG